MKILLAAALIVVIGAVLLFGYRQWWIDTHCTTILGTQVCQTSAPAPPPAPAYTPCALQPGHPVCGQ